MKINHLLPKHLQELIQSKRLDVFLSSTDILHELGEILWRISSPKMTFETDNIYQDRLINNSFLRKITLTKNQIEKLIKHKPGTSGVAFFQIHLVCKDTKIVIGYSKGYKNSQNICECLQICSLQSAINRLRKRHPENAKYGLFAQAGKHTGTILMSILPVVLNKIYQTNGVYTVASLPASAGFYRKIGLKQIKHMIFKGSLATTPSRRINHLISDKKTSSIIKIQTVINRILLVRYFSKEGMTARDDKRINHDKFKIRISDNSAEYKTTVESPPFLFSFSNVNSYIKPPILFGNIMNKSESTQQEQIPPANKNTTGRAMTMT